MVFGTEAVARFKAMYVVDLPSGCWLWRAGPRRQFRLGSQVLHANRIAWELAGRHAPEAGCRAVR